MPKKGGIRMGELSAVSFANDYGLAVMGKAMQNNEALMEGAVNLIEQSAPPRQGYGDVLDTRA
jgi:hypothetical protein